MHVTMHQLFRPSVTSYLTLAYSMREKNMLPLAA